jgi:hypothetical protein
MMSELKPLPSIEEQNKSLEKQGVTVAHREFPKFPMNTLRDGKEGAALLTAIIGLDGKVASLDDITIDKMIGDKAFSIAAAKALLLWRWDTTQAKPGVLPARLQVITTFCVSKR